MLVDHDVDQQSEAHRHLRHSMLRRGARGAEGDHVGGDRARAGGGAGDHHTATVRLQDGAAQLGPADHRGKLQLVAPGHEDPGDAFHVRHQGGVVRFLPRLWMQPDHRGDAHPVENLPVELGGCVPQARGRAQDGDFCFGSTRQLDESGEDHPVSELVLGSSDHHHRTDGLTIGSARQPGRLLGLVHW